MLREVAHIRGNKFVDFHAVTDWPSEIELDEIKFALIGLCDFIGFPPTKLKLGVRNLFKDFD